MEEMLTSGITLVVDRYSFSGIAFSVAKVFMRRCALGNQITLITMYIYITNLWHCYDSLIQ